MNTKKTLAAIDIIESGEVFSINEIQFVKRDNILLVSGSSNYISINSINKDIAIKELQSIKDVFYSLLDEWEDFKNYTKKISVDFVLFYDDNGKCSITICEEKNNIIFWSV